MSSPRLFSNQLNSLPIAANDAGDWIIVEREKYEELLKGQKGAALPVTDEEWQLVARQVCEQIVKNQVKMVSIGSDEDDYDDEWVYVENTESEDFQVSPTLKSRFMDSLILVEAGYNFVITFSETTYTSAVMVTNVTGMTGGVIGLAYPAIVISIPIGLLLAAAETYAHRAESKHFDSADKSDVAQEAKPFIAKADTTLTWGQSISSGVHYAADIYKGAAVPLLFAKLAGLDRACNVMKITTYVGTGVISVLGNLREYVNTRVAFEQENKREAAAESKSPSPK